VVYNELWRLLQRIFTVQMPFLIPNQQYQSTKINQTVEVQTNDNTHLAHLDNSRYQCHYSAVQQSHRPCIVVACNFTTQQLHTAQTQMNCSDQQQSCLYVYYTCNELYANAAFIHSKSQASDHCYCHYYNGLWHKKSL